MTDGRISALREAAKLIAETGTEIANEKVMAKVELSPYTRSYHVLDEEEEILGEIVHDARHIITCLETLEQEI